MVVGHNRRYVSGPEDAQSLSRYVSRDARKRGNVPSLAKNRTSATGEKNATCPNPLRSPLKLIGIVDVCVPRRAR